MTADEQPDYDWDVFISYAGEDRTSLVEPLASELSEIGVKVWWDQFELSVGDSLTGKINQGLSRSRYGIVVLSKDFLAKQWPDYELRGLTIREVSGTKVILPVWFELSFADLVAVNPPLAEKRAIEIGPDYSRRELWLESLRFSRSFDQTF